MPDLDVQPHRIAFGLVLLSFTGRPAVDQHLREVHGIDPADHDRVDLIRQHMRAHGASITDDGVIHWPVRQDPPLWRLLPDRGQLRVPDLVTVHLRGH